MRRIYAMEQTTQLGTHLILDIKGCTFADLNNETFLKRTLLEIAEVGNMTVLFYKSHKFYPQGVTSFLLLAESHLSIHTWPEKGIATLDYYTCNPVSRVEYVENYVREHLKPTEVKSMILNRQI
jgi:S-adenosylmethionine decarboxylase